MTEQALFILAVLTAGELHGYGIAQEVKSLSAGQVKLTAGTLYGAIGRLSEQGLIEQTREEEVGGRLRRYYELTSFGATTLERETARMKATADALSARTVRTGIPRPGIA